MTLFIVKFLANILKILNSEESPNQLAAGFAWGMMIGLLPVKGLFPYVLLFLAFLVNINLGMVSLSTLIFKLISYVVDPIANQLGYHLLVQIPSLKPFWTKMYNMPVLPYTNFNNTITLGSFVIGVLFFIPLFFISRWAVGQYRTKFRDKVQKFKIVQIFKTSSIYRLYESYQGIRGE